MLSTQGVVALPIITQQQRDQLEARPKAEHSSILNEQVFAKAVETQPAPTATPLETNFKVIGWNAERGKHLDISAELLASLEADILLLTEMDHGMARSEQCHTPARLAQKLDYGYVYGIEFLEFGLGTLEETKQCAGQNNDAGYHGNAILSRAELKRPALIRLDVAGDWFNPGNPESRLGGRMATLATVDAGGSDVTLAAVHFEDRTSPETRGRQMKVLVDGIEEYAPGNPVVIAGDLNSNSFDLHKSWGNLERVRQLIEKDPGRFLCPIPHEPLFAVAAQSGYDWQSCNQMNVPTERITAKPLSLRGCRKIDWFLTRGLAASGPATIAATPADIAWPLSDHELISVNLKATAT